MTTEGVSGDWVEAEIARQLESVSLDDDSDGEMGIQGFTSQQVMF